MRMSFAQHIRRMLKEAQYEHGPVKVIAKDFKLCDPPVIVEVARKRPKEQLSTRITCPFCNSTGDVVFGVCVKCVECGAIHSETGAWTEGTLAAS